MPRDTDGPGQGILPLAQAVSPRDRYRVLTRNNKPAISSTNVPSGIVEKGAAVMFKVAAITDEISQDPAVAATLLREFGGEGLEIRSVWEKSPHELEADEIRRLKHIADAHSLHICGIASPVFKCSLGSVEEERQHLDMLRRCIELAHALDTDLIRVFTFWQQPGQPPWEAIAEKFLEPLRLAEQAGVRLGIENERSTMAASARKVADFLALMNHPHLVAIWDPGNEHGYAEGSGAFPAGYAMLKPWVAHVQIKDVKRRADGSAESVRLGAGDIDYPGQLRALKRDGYRGYLSLETHWRLGHALPKEVTRQPKGSVFSAGGEEATRLCLQGLRELLRQV
jgi:L-ribulose-5-phosphate 3-epimerase